MAHSPEIETAPVAAPAADDVAIPALQPLYNVVLIDDDEHTYHYVIAMLCRIVGVDFEMAYLMARAVDCDGRVIVLTTDRDTARNKRDAIKSFGPDPLIAHSTGSMHAVIEPLLP
jgi:ATP-dependent Clp protease adaptor protein ClpS